MPQQEVKKTKKTKRRRGHTLENWEVAIVKAMISRGSPFTNDQDILAYFTRPTRSVNHRLISEIRNEAKHKAIKAATEDNLDAFLATWPDIDHETGLSIRGDELLVKAREAMIAAVQTFNSAGLTFRAELFIVWGQFAALFARGSLERERGSRHRVAANATMYPAVSRAVSAATRFVPVATMAEQRQSPGSSRLSK